MFPRVANHEPHRGPSAPIIAQLDAMLRTVVDYEVVDVEVKARQQQVFEQFIVTKHNTSNSLLKALKSAYTVRWFALRCIALQYAALR